MGTVLLLDKGSDNLHTIRKIKILSTILHKYHKQLHQMSVRETLFLRHPIYQNLVSNVYVHHPMTTMGVQLLAIIYICRKQHDIIIYFVRCLKRHLNLISQPSSNQKFELAGR